MVQCGRSDDEVVPTDHLSPLHKLCSDHGVTACHSRSEIEYTNACQDDLDKLAAPTPASLGVGAVNAR